MNMISKTNLKKKIEINMISRTKLLMATLLGIAVLATGVGQQALGAEVSLLNSSSDWTTATDWSNGEAPSSGNDYFVNSGYYIRPPAGSSSVTFGGGSLTIGDELTTGKLSVNDASQNVTVKINNLTLKNGMYQSYNAKTHTLISDQAIQVAGPFTFEHRSGTTSPLGTKIDAVLAGSGDITVSGRSGASGSKNFIEFLQANTVSGSLRMINYVDFNVKNALAVQNLTLDMQSTDTGRLNFSQDSTVGGLTGSRNVDLGGYEISVGNKNENNTYSGVISNGSLTKIGTGTWSLTNTNTFSGATLVSGTLYVGGELTNSAVTVQSDGTIGSNGSAGILGNGLTIKAGGNLDLTGASLGPNSSDILSITSGELTLGELTFQDLVGWDWLNADPGTYQLIDGTFSVDFGSTDYLSAATAYDFGNGKSGYFTEGSLNAVIIPEPGVALLSALGLLALLRRRR